MKLKSRKATKQNDAVRDEFIRPLFYIASRKLIGVILAEPNGTNAMRCINQISLPLRVSGWLS
jgi:hypothetical protein